MRTSRWIAYGLLLLAVLSLFGWLSREQARADAILQSELNYPTPTSEPLPAGLAADTKVRLEQLATHFTNRYRRLDVPLRVRVLKDKAEKPYLRLGVAVIIPRWYTARTAHALWQEARSVAGYEVPIHIHETYIFGQSRWIGECVRQPDDTEPLVRLIR
ncbi:MAG: hypothetical protein SNJ72_04460 [Fimbriimonadales bacterium]